MRQLSSSSTPQRLRSSLVLAVVCAVILLYVGPGFGQIVDPDLWVPNGPVHAVACAEGTIYLGGQFTRVSPPTGPAAAVDVLTGKALAPYTRVDGVVDAVAPDGSGGWYIAGSFASVQGQPRANLAHLGPDGHLTSWRADADSSVTALVLVTGTVYAAGFFSEIGGQPRNRIAALDATTGEATGWNPSAEGPQCSVSALVVSGSTIYVGGTFTAIGGQVRSSIAALDAVSGLATEWNPEVAGTVYAMAASGSTVYVGGDFIVSGGQPRNNIAALDATTGAATSWNPDANDLVQRLAVSDGIVYAAGWFTKIGGLWRFSLAALDATSGTSTAWNAGSDGYVTALDVASTTVYVGGEFTEIGGQPRSGVAALDPATADATSWDPSPDGPWVSALSSAGDVVYIGGGFNSIGGESRANIAAVDAATGGLTSWDPSANDLVKTLTVRGATVYAGGRFTRVGGQARYRLAALDVTSGAASSWAPTVEGGSVYPVVSALDVSGNTVYIGGEFTTVAGHPRSHVAAIDATTGSVTDWTPDANSSVSCLVVGDGVVYTGGIFDHIGGEARDYVAALDAASGVASEWDPGPDFPVQSVALGEGTVYVGGRFGHIGGAPRQRLAALEVASGVATGWDPGASGHPSVSVAAVVPSGDVVYVGGFFTGVGGQARNYVAAVDSRSGSATSWNPNVEGFLFPSPYPAVYCVRVHEGRVFVGGAFTSVGGVARSCLVGLSRLRPRHGVMPPPHAAGEPALVMRAVPNPTDGEVVVEYFLPAQTTVHAAVYDVLGRLVGVLAAGVQGAGSHALSWSGRDARGERVSSGVYFLRMTDGCVTGSRKVVVRR